MKTITKQQAEAEGYRPMTTAYRLPQEEWMLNNVVADMRRGKINFVFVAESTGVEVWKQ
jgi:hypothetical protein